MQIYNVIMPLKAEREVNMRKTTKRRLSSLLCAVLMLVTSIDVTAFAAESKASKRKIDVWDIGTVQEADTDKYNNHITAVDRENIQIEIYERGAGYTYASGTGACAAASAAHKLGLVGNRVQVHMQGGDLLVEFAEDDRVFMTGPVVYIGSITLAENFFA